MRINVPLFLTLEHAEQSAIIESLIFAASSDENLSAENIYSIVLLSNSSSTVETKKTIKNNNKFNDLLKNFSINDSENSDNNRNINDANENIGNELSNESKHINKIAEEMNFTVATVEKIIEEINENLDNSNRPYRIVNYAGGYQFATLPQYGEIIYKMLKSKMKKSFSAAQLETLSIIAYKQPVTKQEIDRIRGITSSGEIINTLIDKQLVKISGRKEVIGKPLLYATTQEFLKTFGLNLISDLPKLREIEEIAEQKMQKEEQEINEFTLNIMQSDIDNLGKNEVVSEIENFENEINNQVENIDNLQ